MSKLPTPTKKSALFRLEQEVQVTDITHSADQATPGGWLNRYERLKEHDALCCRVHDGARCGARAHDGAHVRIHTIDACIPAYDVIAQKRVNLGGTRAQFIVPLCDADHGQEQTYTIAAGTYVMRACDRLLRRLEADAEHAPAVRRKMKKVDSVPAHDPAPKTTSSAPKAPKRK